MDFNFHRVKKEQRQGLGRSHQFTDKKVFQSQDNLVGLRFKAKFLFLEMLVLNRHLMTI